MYARTELRAGQGEPGLQEEGKEAAAEVGVVRAYDYLWYPEVALQCEGPERMLLPGGRGYQGRGMAMNEKARSGYYL